MGCLILFVKAPAIEPLPILFVKSITPALVPLEALPEFDPGFEFNKPMTWHMFDVVIKALRDGEVSVSDAAGANDAYLCGRPLPHTLIELVAARAALSPSGA